jgi:hypothetical protein
MNEKERSASSAGGILLGEEISVHRLGFGAMRLTGERIWGRQKITRERWRFFAELRNCTSISLIRQIPTAQM